MGFHEVIQRDFPNLVLEEQQLTRDDADVVSTLTTKVLRKGSKITALYNAGAGNSGLVEALRLRTNSIRPICIVHELVPHSYQALLDNHIDLVIDQQPDTEVDRALAVLKALIDITDLPPMPDLVPAIYVRDNLPEQFPVSFEKVQS